MIKKVIGTIVVVMGVLIVARVSAIKGCTASVKMVIEGVLGANANVAAVENACAETVDNLLGK